MIIHKGIRRPSKVMPPNRPSGAAVQELVLCACVGEGTGVVVVCVTGAEPLAGTISPLTIVTKNSLEVTKYK